MLHLDRKLVELVSIAQSLVTSGTSPHLANLAISLDM